MSRRALLAALGWALAGCCAFVNGAGHCPSVWIPSTFSQRYLCPEDRVTTRERPDLPYRSFVCPGAEGCEDHPPADVAGDPERLALWRRTRREAYGEPFDESATTTLEVTGCGEHRFYACSRVHGKGRLPVSCEGSALIDLGAKEPGTARAPAPQ